MANVSSSNSQGANVPKLRFKRADGSDYEQYKNETVGSLFAYITRRNTNMECVNVITNSAELGLIAQKEFFDKDIAVEGNTEKYYVIEQGDFVYNPRKSASAPYGPFNCYKRADKGIVSPLYTCLTPLFPQYTDFLLWYFASPAWHSYIYHNGAQGGARHDRVGMTKDLMDGIPVNIPELEEQEKINKFLSLMEHRLELQRKLVDALKSYKRGALSRLFPKNGSSVPEYRFAGFTGKWKQRKLGEVSRRNIVGLATSVTPYYRTEGVPILRNLNIKENYLDDADILFLERDYAESQINKQIHTGDVLTVHTGYIGTSCVVPEKYDNCLTFTTLITTTNPSILLGEFLSQYLNSDIGMDAVQAVTTQGGRQNLNTNDFVKVKISFPEIREQKKICAALSQLDTLITLHQKKFEQYIDLKRSMLEKLFI